MDLTSKNVQSLIFFIYRLCVCFTFSCIIMMILLLSDVLFLKWSFTSGNLVLLFLKLNFTRCIFLSVCALNGPAVSLISPTTLSRLLFWGQSLSSRILTWSIRYSRSVAVFGPQTTHRSAHVYADFYRRNFNPLVILMPANNVGTNCISVLLIVKSHETDHFECMCYVWANVINFQTFLNIFK